MAIDPRAILTMLMAGTGVRTGALGASGLDQQPGPGSAPSAFGSPTRAVTDMGPGGIPGLFPPRTVGLAGPIRRRMRHAHAKGAVNAIPRALVKSPTMPGTRKGLQTLKGA